MAVMTIKIFYYAFLYTQKSAEWCIISVLGGTQSQAERQKEKGEDAKSKGTGKINVHFTSNFAKRNGS